MTPESSQHGGPSRRRYSTKPKSPTALPTPVQLSVPAPRWSLTTRIKERDIWGLGLSSDLPVDEDALFAPKPTASSSDGNGGLSRRVGAIRLSSDTDVRSLEASSSTHIHPLQGKTSSSSALHGQADGADDEILGDVSRPALKRLTSDMERMAGEGLSRRGSATDSRKGKEKAEVEVEVLIHQVSPNETVAGIALLYGIDLSTLRKVNKLWPSDPAHLRKHLYVPLEACRWDRAKGSGGISLIRGPGEGQVTLVERGAYLAAAGTEPEKGCGARQEGDLIDVASNDGIGVEEESTGGAGNVQGTEWRTPIPEPSPIQWTGWHAGAPPAKAGSEPSHGSSGGPAQLSPAASLEDPWANASSSSTTVPSTGDQQSGWPSFDGASSPPGDSPHPAADRGNGQDIPPGSRILDVVRIPASQLRFFPSAKQNPGSSRTSFDSAASASRTSLQLARADLAISTITSPDLGGQGPSISNDMHYPDAASTGGLPPKPRSKSTMVRLRPPTSGELPPTSFANRISNLFSIPPPPPGLGSGAAPSSARTNRRSARHASMDATHLLSPSGGGRMSLDSARSAYSALSGKSGKSGGSGRSAGGMSRSGSLRALGLSGLEGISIKEGEVKRDEVEMQRRGSKDTLKPVDAKDGSGVARVGSLRRGKKLD